MEFQFSAGALGALLAIAAGCVLLQRFFRSKLSRDQYFYMRDLSCQELQGGASVRRRGAGVQRHIDRNAACGSCARIHVPGAR